MSRVLETLIHLDRALFRWIFRLKWGPASFVLRVFTVLGSAGFIWGVFAFFAFVFVWMTEGFRPGYLIFTWFSVAASWTVAECVKFVFKRSRPFIHDSEIAPLIKTPSSSSFPSGHSATAAAGAISLSYLYPALTPFFVVAAFFVMLSRVYLGVHFPFDVLAGAFIGTVVSVVVLLLA